MYRRFSINFAVISVLLDLGIINICLLAATQFRPLLNRFSFIQNLQPPLEVPGMLYPLFALTWVAILLLFSVYNGRRNIRFADEFTSLTLGSILATVSLAGTLYLSYREVSRVLFLVFILMGYASMLSWRSAARIIFRLRNGSSETRRVIIIGAGPVGRELQQKIIQHPFLGLKLVGFLDDSPRKRQTEGNILGPIDQARNVILAREVDDVVIALPRRAHERVNRLVAELHNMPIKVWVIPDYFHLALHKATIDEFAGIPMLDLKAPALDDSQRFVKRTFDLVLAVVVLLPTLVLMALIALAIRLEGPGPVIFRQQRVGENGRVFGMYKFRTMVLGAENLLHLVAGQDSRGNVVHKRVDDPRITRTGAILRRMSLDEIPQIFNILKGEMSLVGPRPEMPYLVDRYEPWQHRRFAVPQGLTGWWQINGRSDKPMHLHTEDDLYYVQNYSLLLDIQILIKTVWAVLRGTGAF